LLANRILTGTGSSNIEELEKANVTLKVITLEHTGTLRESISFPAFDYKNLATQVWYEEDTGKMSDFHEQLEGKRFLFVVFQKKEDSSDITLKKIKFWNFPAQDMVAAEKVFNKAVESVREGRYENMPKMSESAVAHVRPHAMDSSDTILTPQGTQEIKRCFWLNAKYIKKSLEI
jgi:DNA mismatch repair protein MutH